MHDKIVHLTKEEAEIIIKIVQRALIFYPNADVLSLTTDILTTHTNDCPLKLDELLNAPAFDFTHDIVGISNNINWRTGKLENLFLPRYAKDEQEINDSLITGKPIPEEPITKDNIKINEDLIAFDNYINSYVAAYFDVDKKFGTSTYDTDDYINLFANYYPDEKRLEVYYIIQFANGDESNSIQVELTDSEKEAILFKMKEAGLDDYIKQIQEEFEKDETVRSKITIPNFKFGGSEARESLAIRYPVGTRVELNYLCNDESDMPKGLRGTVVGHDYQPALLMAWDNNRSLSLFPGEDSFRQLTPDEIAAELNEQEGGMKLQ